MEQCDVMTRYSGDNVTRRNGSLIMMVMLMALERSNGYVKTDVRND